MQIAKVQASLRMRAISPEPIYRVGKAESLAKKKKKKKKHVASLRGRVRVLKEIVSTESPNSLAMWHISEPVLA